MRTRTWLAALSVWGLTLCSPAMQSAMAADELIDAIANKVYRPSDWKEEISEEAKALHSRFLFIADLHADTFLWERDVIGGTAFGHVDLPRLQEGNVALQVFALVTKTPVDARKPVWAELINPDARRCIKEDNRDQVSWLRLLQGRFPIARKDLRVRAVDEISLLLKAVHESRSLAERAPGQRPYFKLIATAQDLRDLLDERRQCKPAVGVLIAIEGAHWIGRETAQIQAAVKDLKALKVRMVAPTHRFNNQFGAASEGCIQTSGLTPSGLELLQQVESNAMLVDLAHASDRAIEMALDTLSAPVVISHTGIRRLCPTKGDDEDCDYERNLPDRLVQAIARNGGIVGIGFWPEAVGRGMQRLALAFAATKEILSDRDFAAEMRLADPAFDPVRHIALGSDFDGAVKTPFDVAHLAALTDLLMTTRAADGRPVFDLDDLSAIYGGNVCRLLAKQLSGGSEALADEVCRDLVRDQAFACPWQRPR